MNNIVSIAKNYVIKYYLFFFDFKFIIFYNKRSINNKNEEKINIINNNKNACL